MVIFVFDTGDRECYPPHGLRVSINHGLPELKEDMLAFFVEAEDCSESEAAALNEAPPTEDSLIGQLNSLSRGRKWSLVGTSGHYIF